jgi:hypothetical protein
MGLDADSVFVIHGGGVYGDKVETLSRIKKTIMDILPPNVRGRLVLENDEVQRCSYISIYFLMSKSYATTRKTSFPSARNSTFRWFLVRLVWFIVFKSVTYLL